MKGRVSLLLSCDLFACASLSPSLIVVVVIITRVQGERVSLCGNRYEHVMSIFVSLPLFFRLRILMSGWREKSREKGTRAQEGYTQVCA